MKYKDFEELITLMQDSMLTDRKIHLLGIDLSSYSDNHYKIIDMLAEKAFGHLNKEWIDWFLYERITHTGEILKAHDKDGNEICYDIKSLWEEITK